MVFVSLPFAVAQTADPKGGATPGDAALEFLLGVLQGDHARVSAVTLNQSNFHRDLNYAATDFGKSATSFRLRFIATYGRAAWQAFNDREHRLGEGE